MAVWAALGRPGALRLTDLGVYVGAVEGLRHGASLYDFVSAGNAPFTYPPFAGLVFLPLADVAVPLLQCLWTLGTLVTVVLVAQMVARETALPAPALAFVLILSAPISSNFKYGQVSVFLAAMITADVLLLRGRRAHGVLIGVAAAIKLTPLIFIPMLWLAGRRRAAVTAAATFTTCGAVAALALPGDSWRFWTTEITQVSRLGYITSVGNQSLNGVLMRFGISAADRSLVVVVVGGGIALLASVQAGRVARRGDWLSAVVITGSASVVLSPVSWTHHQVWLVLAALLPLRGRIRGYWMALVLAVMLLPVTALGPPVWSNIRFLLAVAVTTVAPFLLVSPDRRDELGLGSVGVTLRSVGRGVRRLAHAGAGAGVAALQEGSPGQVTRKTPTTAPPGGSSRQITR
ncbi:glycosyltransferase 87 family protein [Winogradskya humida]|uniref:glycosyltransferase 87 family protein n=1 Tax=Winogradskya humida TaxID=113566 RepID=UPI001943902C|nr:glycosyltransferase 87 family protein [Actinoplanes humidus]